MQTNFFSANFHFFRVKVKGKFCQKLLILVFRNNSVNKECKNKLYLVTLVSLKKEEKTDIISLKLILHN